MYDITLITVTSKVTDFKICEQCGGINWYENKECRHCVSQMHDKASRVFDEKEESVNKWITSEYDFYMREEDMERDEADEVLVEV